MEMGILLSGKCVGSATRQTKSGKQYQEISVLVQRNDGASDLHRVRDYGNKVKVEMDKPCTLPVFISAYVQGTVAFVQFIALGPLVKGSSYAGV